jgi:hypothetical protein
MNTSTNTVLSLDEARRLAASLARKSGGKKRQDFRAVVEQVDAEVQMRIQHLEAERARVEQRRLQRERDERVEQQRPLMIRAIRQIAAATFPEGA